MSWWDGPRRFHYVNRNIICSTQREVLFNLVKHLFARDIKHGKYGVEIGGPGGPEEYALGLDVVQSDAHNQVVADGNCLPFKDNSLDYILSTASIEHIPGDPVAIFQEWVRALRDGGIIACMAPALEFHGAHDDHPERPDWQAPNEYNTEEWREIIKKVKDIEIIQFDTMQNNMFIDIVLKKY